MGTYSYHPEKITEGGVDQMRFELGDTVVHMDGMVSPLCDEEYLAIIQKHGKNWKQAKYECLSAICMKLSYEVNTSIDGLSYSLSERYNRFKAMKDDLKKELAAVSGVPRAGNPASLSPHGRTPYYYNDMMANRRKF